VVLYYTDLHVDIIFDLNLDLCSLCQLLSMHTYLVHAHYQSAVCMCMHEQKNTVLSTVMYGADIWLRVRVICTQCAAAASSRLAVNAWRT
jgi:hypothetical protein